MKKILLVVTVLTSLLFGCNTRKKSDENPRVVVINFFDAIQKKDIDAAKDLATADSKSMLNIIDMALKVKSDFKLDEFDQSNMEFSEAKINGDNATVSVKEKTSGEATNLSLKRENGEWKVAFDLSSLMEMGVEQMKNSGNGITDSISNSFDQLNIDSIEKEMEKGMKKLEENKEKIEEAVKELNKDINKTIN